MKIRLDSLSERELRVVQKYSAHLLRMRSENVGLAKRGDQIVYQEDETAGPQYGFVVKVTKAGTVLCRFWVRDGGRALRTRPGGEECHPAQLCYNDSMPQAFVDKELARIALEEERDDEAKRFRKGNADCTRPPTCRG